VAIVCKNKGQGVLFNHGGRLPKTEVIVPVALTVADPVSCSLERKKEKEKEKLDFSHKVLDSAVSNATAP
jgi:hypothetical protein